jgi:hypothetical protein
VIRVSYLEHKISIKIVENEDVEPDEDFFIELYDPGNNMVLLGSDVRTKVTIID